MNERYENPLILNPRFFVGSLIAIFMLLLATSFFIY
jgi:hypothetical protein